MNENKKNIFKEITKWLIIICTTFVILSTSSLIFTSGILFGASHHDHVNNVVNSVFDNHESTKKEAKHFSYVNAEYISTPIPVNGFVESIYFNTDLSNEQILSICQSLQYESLSALGLPYLATFFYVDLTSNQALGIVSTGESYNIVLADISTFDITNLWYPTDDYHWADDFVSPITFNSENNLETFLSNIGFSVIQNDLVSQLLSITPFELSNPTYLELVFEDLKIVVSESLKLLSDFAIDLKYVFYDFENNHLTVVGILFAFSLAFGVISALFALIRNLMIGRR